MDRNIQVLIVDESQGSRNALRTMLAGADVAVVGETVPGPEAFTQAKELVPHVILLTIEEPLVRALKTLEAMVTNFPDIPIVASSSLQGRDQMRKAMLAGARDFLTKPLNRVELRDALEAIVRQEEKRKLFRQANVSTSSDHGSIVTVFGPKGGVGKSTVAVNLSIAMAKAQQRVALLDMDIQAGCDAILLNLAPKKDYLGLLNNEKSFDPEVLKSYMTTHSSGLDLLAAPSQLVSREEEPGPEEVAKLLEGLSSTYEYVVVDTPPTVDESVRVLLRASTYILVLTSLEVSSISVVKKHLDTMRNWEFARDKIKVVMNVPNSSNSVTQADIEDVLGTPVFWSIPHDPKVSAGNQHGEPVVDKMPNSNAARAISSLHFTLTGLKAPSRGGLFGLIGAGRKG